MYLVHKYSVEELKLAVSQSESYAQVLLKLGIDAHGGNYKTLKSRILANSIDTSHFTGMSWSKGHSLKKRDIQDYLSNKCKIGSHILKVKLINNKILEHKCYSCNLTEWCGQPIPIELHHIDGNRENNNLSNLQILCPNCHAQTDNYCSKKIKQPKSNKKTRARTKQCLCGTPIISSSKQCRPCKNLTSSKSRPSINELIENINLTKNISQTAKYYNVSRQSVINWCQQYNVDYKSITYKTHT